MPLLGWGNVAMVVAGGCVNGCGDGCVNGCGIGCGDGCGDGCFNTFGLCGVERLWMKFLTWLFTVFLLQLQHTLA